VPMAAVQQLGVYVQQIASASSCFPPEDKGTFTVILIPSTSHQDGT